MRVFCFLLLGYLILSLLGCSFVEEERLKDEIHSTYGIQFNSTREKLQLPLIDDNIWKQDGFSKNGNVGVCVFNRKDLPSQSSTARHFSKKIYFYKDSKALIRETDVYISGKRYYIKDLDNQNWESLEISYAFISDSIPELVRLHSYVDQPAQLKKGSRSFVLYSPIPTTATTGNGDKKVTFQVLQEREISKIQADSTLKAWGLHR